MLISVSMSLICLTIVCPRVSSIITFEDALFSFCMALFVSKIHPSMRVVKVQVAVRQVQVQAYSFFACFCVFLRVCRIFAFV